MPSLSTAPDALATGDHGTIPPLNIGIIGCGNISQTYFNAAKTFPVLNVVACADINKAAAQAKAAEHGVRELPVDDLLKMDEIDAIINLTIPAAHAEITLRALEAGKHVHGEKPLAVTREEGQAIVRKAREQGLRVSSAPDTFLGAGLQTCRKILNDGWLGRPIGGNAVMLGHGPEGWHPNPGFFYQKGAGPMFDMGPYYLTALVSLLGPVKRVAAITGKAFPQRLATCKEHYGEWLPVEVPTHLAGTLEFHNGAIVTVTISFDVWNTHNPNPIAIFGTEGSLQAPDPNGFGGTVHYLRGTAPGWQEMPHSHGYADNMRSIGLADMAYALHSGRPHRCSLEMAYHVLDVMHTFEESSLAGSHLEVASTCPQPAPLPLGLPHGMLDS
ncbi:MAG TPA: Gfo/Idh/MocA family oxidoreductase [Armatimonadota bacterium]|jgi:predicted dehydrogenase